MNEWLIETLNQFPPQIAAFLAAAIPLTEIQLALPLAIHAWELSPWQAWLWSVLGNLLPFVPVYYGLEYIRRAFFAIWPRLGRAFETWLASAQGKVQGQYEKYGAFGLFLYTALPFPLTGIYTAIAAAVLLRIPFSAAFPAIALGIVVNGFIILLLSLTPDLLF